MGHGRLELPEKACVRSSGLIVGRGGGVVVGLAVVIGDVEDDFLQVVIVDALGIADGEGFAGDGFQGSPEVDDTPSILLRLAKDTVEVGVTSMDLSNELLCSVGRLTWMIC